MILKSIKQSLFIGILFLSNTVCAQQALDTLCANDVKNVALFFPNPIRQAVTGNDNFVFTYNQEKAEYLGLLQAIPGTESNLLVITVDGHVYAYILKYSKELPQLNYFVQSEESIGTEYPKEVTQSTKPTDSIKNPHKSFQKTCDLLVKTKQQTITAKRKKRIRLQLENIIYKGQEVYLVLGVRNTSKIDFEMDYLDISIVNGNNKRKASYQELQLKPIYTYQKPKIIQIGQTKRMVYALPKFVLGDTQKLKLELKELNGNRKVFLKTTL